MIKFDIGQKVRILKNGVPGCVVDVMEKERGNQYIIESDLEDVEGDYGGQWPLFYCTEDEIEAVE